MFYVHRAERADGLVDALGAMAAGRKVVFVDVREADEFMEGHIPGAINVPLRDAGPHCEIGWSVRTSW